VVSFCLVLVGRLQCYVVLVMKKVLVVIALVMIGLAASTLRHFRDFRRLPHPTKEVNLLPIPLSSSNGDKQ